MNSLRVRKRRRPVISPSGPEMRALRDVENSVGREAARGATFRARRRGNPRWARLGAAPGWISPRLTRCAALLVAAISLGGVSPLYGADPDWHRVGDETADLLADVIRVDTQNPPGAETAAANLLARKLEAEGVAAQVFESAPGRGNLYARLPGNGTSKPVVLLAHLDVVPADPRGWRLPPFSGTREHGYVYGRGALDAKGVAATELMALLAVKRAGPPLDRDIILLATAE